MARTAVAFVGGALLAATLLATFHHKLRWNLLSPAQIKAPCDCKASPDIDYCTWQDLNGDGLVDMIWSWSDQLEAYTFLNLGGTFCLSATVGGPSDHLARYCKGYVNC